MSKHFRFVHEGENSIVVRNKQGLSFGEICFDMDWYDFVFKPQEGTYYSKDCLAEIIKQIKKLKEEGRAGEKK